MRVPLDSSLDGLDGCGCCAGTEPLTPEPLANRPGLAAIRYRVGTHSTFFASLLSGLSGAERPRLRGLGTRDPSDFTIAFLDAVATAADVLTFYSERIANESYLRTATERRSVRELTRAIGYELAPGLAAETALAFELDREEGLEEVRIEAGTRVQSVPLPDQRPQTFETTAAIAARPEWNRLTPRSSGPYAPRRGDRELFLAGVATGLEPDDAILIVGDERAGDPERSEWDLRFLDAVEPEPERGRTRVAWRVGLGGLSSAAEPAAENPRVYALRLRVGLFGSTAPEWRLFGEEIRSRYGAQTRERGGEGEVEVVEEGEAEVVDRGRDWPGLTIKDIGRAEGDRTEGVVHLEGHHREIPAQPDADARPESWLALVRRDSTRLYRVAEVAESARQDFGLALATTRVELEPAALDDFDEYVRGTVAYAGSEQLTPAPRPLGEQIDGVTVPVPVAGRTIDLSGLVTALPAGRTIVVSGRVAGSAEDAPALAETATVRATEEVDGAFTRIHLTEKLEGSYVRDSVTIAANVAPAGHGESSEEPIGSGDAALPFQRFELRQSPLTYVRDAAGRRRSTLSLRVDGLRWEEVASLYGRGPRERVYAIRHDEDGVARVELGDGRSGARLPGGRENVTAAYRKGLGRGGNLAAGRLTLLPVRPPGVRGVDNPVRAAGGVDPEGPDEARAKAPLTVLTLDRVVSLSDYADFARGYQGVEKAHATWAWGRGGRGVLLSVAGVESAGLPRDDPLLRDLAAALAAAAEPGVEICVRPCETIGFHLVASLTPAAGRLPEQVRAAAEAALRERFSFAARQIGQAVALSEVLAALHEARGVAAADVDALYAAGPAQLHQRLPATLPRPGGEMAGARPAQLLHLELRAGDLKGPG